MIDPITQTFIQQYGILGLAAFLFGDKLLYFFMKKRSSQVSDQTTQNIASNTIAAAATTKAIESMSKAIIELNKKFEGVRFQRMAEEVHWLKETHAAVDPQTGALRWYDKTGELKDALKDLREQIGDLSSAIRDEGTVVKKLRGTVEILDGKVDKILSIR